MDPRTRWYKEKNEATRMFGLSKAKGLAHIVGSAKAKQEQETCKLAHA